MTAAQVASLLGRTTAAVARMRSEVGRDEGIDFRRGYSLDPSHVGSRLLVAKTCIGCGLLLPARWYCYTKRDPSRGKRWSTHCVRCLNGKAKESGSLADANNKRPLTRLARSGDASRVINQITRDKATRHRFPWLEADHVTLRDSTLTLFEKAVTLGRTYAATSRVCSKYGYTSRVGHGDPLQGAWHIDNPNEIAAVGAA